MNIDISTLCAWSDPKRVQTKRGPRNVRSAPVPMDHPFWLVWRDNKPALQGAGISISEWQGKWQASWWQEVSAVEVQAHTQAIETSRALTADIDIPCPDGLAYMPFQKAGISFASSRPNTLIGDPMGVGKTIQAIGVINLDPKICRVLVICPASLKINWFRELTKWLVRPMTVGIADGKCFPTTEIVIVNYDIVHRFEKSTSYFWDLLIVDEAHFLKNSKSRRSTFVLGRPATKKELAEGKKHRSGIPARRKIFMTGTPIVNRPVELWPLIHALDPVRWSNFFLYGKRYCAAKQMDIGRKLVWDFSGASNLAELQDVLRSSILLRRLKQDVLVDLPPKRRQIIELPSDGLEEFLTAERDAEELAFSGERIEELEARVELAKASVNPDDYKAAVSALRAGLASSFDEMSRVRHDLAVAKLPLCIEEIKNDIEERGDAKIIIFAWHVDVVNGLAAAFPNSVKVVGGMSGPDKMKSVDRFQNEAECGPFIGNMIAAGVGLNLTAADLVIFVEEDWVPGNVSQCEDRAHRHGQVKSVLVKHLVVDGSMDSRMVKTTLAKQAIADAALDNITTQEPVIPRRKPSETITVKEMERAALAITPEQILAIHRALNILASMDTDRAREVNGMGFSKFDGTIGHSLADAPFLSAKQAILGQRLCRKYVRQLPEELVAAAGAQRKEKE